MLRLRGGDGGGMLSLGGGDDDCGTSCLCARSEGDDGAILWDVDVDGGEETLIAGGRRRAEYTASADALDRHQSRHTLHLRLDGSVSLTGSVSVRQSVRTCLVDIHLILLLRHDVSVNKKVGTR
jgi:hypothetical protein